MSETARRIDAVRALVSSDHGVTQPELAWLLSEYDALLLRAENDAGTIAVQLATQKVMGDELTACRRLSELRSGVLRTYVAHHSSCAQCAKSWEQAADELKSFVP